MANVKCNAEFRTEEKNPLTAGEAIGFLNGVPGDAAIMPIQVDVGSQRDPWLVLVGLRATWDEPR